MAQLHHTASSDNRVSRSAGCLELDVVWRFGTAASALQAMSASGLKPAQTTDWRLLALTESYERDTGHRGFVLRPGKQCLLPMNAGAAAAFAVRHWRAVLLVQSLCLLSSW